MNALAGGPTNARDAELLERYGCYSGTRSGFCQRLAHPGSAKPGTPMTANAVAAWFKV
jgi:hypothetical protein